MTLIKRKQLLLNIENAPDGYYGNGPSGNVPDVKEGDKLELAIDKIITVLDRMAPASPPNLDALTLTVTENLTGPVNANDLNGNVVSNVYKFADNQLITFTTDGNPEGILNRDGHFIFDATITARLRFRHVKVNAAETKIIDIDYFDQLTNPPLDDVQIKTDSTDLYNITVDISEFRDFYADDPITAPSKSGFFDSVQAQGTVQLLSTRNQQDTELRQVYLEYSADGTFTDTITILGAPYDYRLEDPNPPTTTVPTFSDLPTMNENISGVPTLETGDQIKINSQISNGIKFYYPTIIATSSIIATNDIDDSIGGSSFPAFSVRTLGGFGHTHTFNANSYSEVISGQVQPNDAFGSGTVQSATTITNIRIDTKSVARALTDSTTRYLSPITLPGSTTPWDQGLSGIAGGYDMVSHDTSLDIGVGAFRSALQVIEGRYEYPRSVDYAVYSGPDYSNVVNFPATDYRYMDIDVGTINNVTSVILSFTGANWNDKQPTGLHILLRVEGASPTGGDGWLNCIAAYAGTGNPTGSDGSVGTQTERDAYDINSTSSSLDGRIRRITFGSAPKIGNVIIRVGIQNNSGYYFESISV